MYIGYNIDTQLLEVLFMKKIVLDKQRLILSREKLSITKQEAAKRMQLSQPAYLRYESGDRLPSIHTIQTMATVLGTSVEYLTGESEHDLPSAYFIAEHLDPELFYLVETYKTSKREDQKRLYEYFKEFGDKKSR